MITTFLVSIIMDISSKSKYIGLYSLLNNGKFRNFDGDHLELRGVE
jgi:hypothetical protein